MSRHQHRTVKYSRASTLLQESEKARLTGHAYDCVNQMPFYDLLLINEFGLMELDMGKCQDLFEIIETGDCKKSTMIVSQLPVIK